MGGRDTEDFRTPWPPSDRAVGEERGQGRTGGIEAAAEDPTPDPGVEGHGEGDDGTAGDGRGDDGRDGVAARRRPGAGPQLLRSRPIQRWVGGGDVEGPAGVSTKAAVGCDRINPGSEDVATASKP